MSFIQHPADLETDFEAVATGACDDFMVDLTSADMACRCGFSKLDHVGPQSRRRPRGGSVHELARAFAGGEVAGQSQATIENGDVSGRVRRRGSVHELAKSFNCACMVASTRLDDDEDQDSGRMQSAISVHELAKSFASGASAVSSYTGLEDEDEDMSGRIRRLGSVHELAKSFTSGSVAVSSSFHVEDEDDSSLVRAPGSVHELAKSFDGAAPPSSWNFTGEDLALRCCRQKSVHGVLNAIAVGEAAQTSVTVTTSVTAEEITVLERRGLFEAANREYESRVFGVGAQERACKSPAVASTASTDDAMDVGSRQSTPTHSSPESPEESDEDIQDRSTDQCNAPAGCSNAVHVASPSLNATFASVRQKWTEPARAAEAKSQLEKAEAEDLAESVRKREEAAALAAREKEAALAARQRLEEERALEEELRRTKDAEAHKAAVAERQRIEQREQNRLRKAEAREAAARQQAQLRELAARERAAKRAASRTVVIECVCGAQLMVTPDELNTLQKYVPSYVDKTAEELAEILPTLHMGAWLQGSKHLFK